MVNSRFKKEYSFKEVYKKYKNKNINEKL